MRLVVALGLFSCVCATARAQRSTNADERDAPSFSENVRSEYVLLPTVVEDRHGHFVDGLTRGHFRVTVDGRPVSLESFDRDDSAPVSFAFLVDVSGSMESEEKLEWTKKAIRWILRHTRPGDDFALLAFSEGQVRMVADFGTETKELLRRLKELKADGDTALLDAVGATPSHVVRGRNGKRAILLFTDGVDNSSAISPDELAKTLERVSIPVYAVGLVTRSAFDHSDPNAPALDVTTLQSLADASGGKMFLIRTLEEMSRVGAKIDKEVRRQYLLGFTPSGVGSVRYRTVQISVEKNGAWKVRARKGYQGTSPRG